MPGTDRDRALALGVMMCLQRERHWHFTMSMPQAWFWSTITLGIRPVWTLTRRFERYREHERMVLLHFCDALDLHIARQDVRPLREALNVATPVHGVGAKVARTITPLFCFAAVAWACVEVAGMRWSALTLWLSLVVWAMALIILFRQRSTIAHDVRRHREDVVNFVMAFNGMAHHYDLDSIDVEAARRGFDPNLAEVFATLLPPWNGMAIGSAGEVRHYVMTTSLELRTELAQRLAELRWTPIEADDDGVARVR